ncbi:hypothetical protein IEO21_10652 [Rhodonia placenta]|uniref:Uncharacterized protein n=1 Tax=Rhodonia placenta TaxID=104341 RepID=A0A8H7NS41_9APHY|nr:hypothetical protein IEO21_10652 [Postia placenta]
MVQSNPTSATSARSSKHPHISICLAALSPCLP